MRENENNVEIVGTISDVRVGYETCGETFYEVTLAATRLSGSEDIIPVTIPGRLCDIESLSDGCRVRIFGEFRSLSRHEDGRHKVILSVFTQEIELLDCMQDGLEVNSIVLDGYICKEPSYRKTPLGREITDLIIASNRSYGKADYIPSIVWGRNARYASRLAVGSHIKVWGRIQSREYRKMISEDEFETKTAYEVSISKIEEVQEDD